MERLTECRSGSFEGYWVDRSVSVSGIRPCTRAGLRFRIRGSFVEYWSGRFRARTYDLSGVNRGLTKNQQDSYR
jgi:hypothetical protein